MSSNDVLIIIVMIVGYSIPIIILIWVYTIAFSFRRGAPYVPSHKRNYKRALDALKLKDGDNVVDLGSGDGRFVFYGAKHYPDVSFTGIELGATLLIWSRFKRFLGGYKNVEFINGDILKQDLTKYNKAYMYLGSDLNEKLAARFEQEAKVGTRIVSLTFDFGDDFMDTHDVLKIDQDQSSVSDNLYVWERGSSQKEGK